MLHPDNKRKLKKFTISFFDSIVEVWVAPMKYMSNGTLALQVYSYEEDYQDYVPFGTLTCNVIDAEFMQSETRAFVKTYSENSGWAKELADKLGKNLNLNTVSGFVTLPLYEFDLENCYD